MKTPPPIESAGAVVLLSSEFFSEARQRLNPGGVFMLWIPYLATLDEFKLHLRTFRSVFPHVDVVLSPVNNGAYFFGSDTPMSFDRGTLETLLGSPQAKADFATAPDDPNFDGVTWAREILADDWMHDAQVDEFVGAGPLITDDHPRSDLSFLVTSG